jgi:hypothetical protein
MPLAEAPVDEERGGGVLSSGVWFVQICGANLSNRGEEAETRSERGRT